MPKFIKIFDTYINLNEIAILSYLLKNDNTYIVFIRLRDNNVKEFTGVVPRDMEEILERLNK